jgi:LacI family repressor for deo operon, udp, cdd, tsx, nupC, and nupG
MSVSLKDVATKAGVSVATVSRVLNERPGVSDRTRSDVLLALDLLGYQAPEQLRRRPGGVVGLVVPELRNPVFPAFAEASEMELSRQGYSQVVCSQQLGGVHEDEHVRRLLEHGVSGLIFVAGIHAVRDADPQRYRTLVDRGVPVVLVNGPLDEVDAAAVSCDTAMAVDIAVRHLADFRHVRIGLAVGPNRYTLVQRRIAGYLEAMRRYLRLDPSTSSGTAMIATSVFTVQGGELAAADLIDRGATAIVCASDLMALGAVREARRRGLAVPQDISIIGSDDSPLLEFTDPPLTTVRQPTADMAGTAVRMLLDDARGEPNPRGEFLFRPDLVLRETTARAPKHEP